MSNLSLLLIVALVGIALIVFCLYSRRSASKVRKNSSGGSVAWMLLFFSGGRMPPPPPQSQIEQEVGERKNREIARNKVS